MKKILLSLVTAAFACLVPSCIEYETEITLKKDGSGTITEEMVMGAQMMQMLEMAALQGGDAQNPIADMKDKAKLDEKAKDYGEGVTVDKIEDIARDNGSKGVRVTYKFTDINKVQFNPAGGMSELGGSMVPEGAGAAKKAEEAKASFKYDGGKLTITLPQPDADELDSGEEAAAEGEEFDPNDPQAQMALQMFKGMKMGAKFTFPGGIAETNASHQDGDSVILMQMDFDEIMKNPKGLEALNQLNGKGPEALGEAMKDLKGVKGETKKEVTVTLK